ncbi:MAG: dihydrofolate reductase [Patescibacteria group bacterium]
MSKSHINIICALSENHAIGRNGKLLWSIPEDLARFKEITTGHPIIMGRKTHESIGRPLPNRTNIIISRNLKATKGGFVSSSLENAIEFASKQEGGDEIFIIGGGEIYKQALPLADKLYLTVVKGDYDGDTFFPDYSAFEKVTVKGNGRHENFQFTFLELEK